MAEFVLKYADGRGEIHQQVATAGSEKELRDRYTQQGFLVYSVKTRSTTGGFGRKKKVNLEKFLIFNQQFVTLIRAGLPILKGLDLLAERLTDPKLGPYIKAVRDEVRNGTLLSEAFRQQGIFPKIYVTSVMAGEKSGSLTEVLDRYITYQKLALAVRKKVLVSLMYPCVLIVLVIVPDGVPGDLRGADVRHAVHQHVGATAGDDGVSDRDRHHGARNYILVLAGAVVGRHYGLSLVVAARGGAEPAGPDQDETAGGGRDLDEVPGGAAFARF